jgi:hypothetical protein
MAKVISGFPGVGKSYFFTKFKDSNVLDSDSSKFDKSEFPENYIKHIKENLDSADLIFVSSHQEVRDALREEGIDFVLVYPDRSIKEEYINRYKQRGNLDYFVKRLESNWEDWMTGLENDPCPTHVKLREGEYLADVIKLFEWDSKSK